MWQRNRFKRRAGSSFLWHNTKIQTQVYEWRGLVADRKSGGSDIFCVAKLDWQFIGDIRLRATFRFPMYHVTDKNSLPTASSYCIVPMSRVCSFLFPAMSPIRACVIRIDYFGQGTSHCLVKKGRRIKTQLNEISVHLQYFEK